MDQNQESHEMRIMQIPLQTLKRYNPPPFHLPEGSETNYVLVYDPQMPSRVPHRLFLQRLILQLRNNLVTYLRFMLVCFIWLGLVPFVARWIWRFYFRFGDWSAIPSPPTVALPATTTNTTDNVTDLPSPSAAALEDTVGNATSGGVLEEGFF